MLCPDLILPQFRHGILVISLDFELYWGVRDQKPLSEYRENLLGVRQVIPALLDLFSKYGIHATWATVGFLFFESRDELLQGLPDRRPAYNDRSLSSYSYIEQIGLNETDDPYHYAGSLIRQISGCPHQEIGSHTLSHYYCLEPGQDAEAFQADLAAAISIAQKRQLSIRSLVFPRNQINREYLSVCRQMGITSWRGNECSWLYTPRNQAEETWFRRGGRLADAYLNLSGHNCYRPDSRSAQLPVNIPASRFLRPVSHSLRLLEPLRLRRIKSDLTWAARHGLIYHLWWHPHNFGREPEQNLAFLQKIFDHFLTLRKQYEMVSLNMGEIAASLPQFQTNAA